MPFTKNDIKTLLTNLSTGWEDLAPLMQNLAKRLGKPAPDGDGVSGDLVNATVGSIEGATPASTSFQALCVGPGGQTDKLTKALSDVETAATLVDALKVALQALIDSEGTGTGTGGTGRAGIEAAFQHFFSTLNVPLNRSQTPKNLAESQLGTLQDLIETDIGTIEANQDPVTLELDAIKDSVNSLSSYPVLTSEISIGPTPGGGSYGLSRGAGSGAGTIPLQRTVDTALREVLGRVPRAADTRSFLSALTASFQVTEVEGHTSFRWTPRAYSGESDLGGGVTGAQASLYTRAQISFDQARPLLDRLYSLKPDFDAEQVEALRSVIRSTLAALVAELGVEGGPRIERVDQFFSQLLGSPDGLDVGLLGQLADQMGLDERHVNTLEEEADFTTFVSIRDYIASIRQSWDVFKKNLKNDLGTRFVLLSRALSVTAESVEEVEDAMDSVFVGEAERQVASFVVKDGNEVIVADLLAWVTSFATDEAPTLIYEGGKIGAGQILVTISILANLVDQFLDAVIKTKPNSIPVGMQHPRVVQPIRELRDYLNRTHTLASTLAPT